MIFDTLIIGGGVSGMQCALILGSGLSKPYAQGKKVGIILHQRNSHLQNALFNNVLGIEKGTKGSDLLESGKNQLTENYPDVHQIENEKVISIIEQEGFYDVFTNKNKYTVRIAVLALNYAKPFSIEGLEPYIMPHQKIS